MPYRLTYFWLTVVKPYYKDNSSELVQDALENALKNALKDILDNTLKDALKDALKENYN